MSFSKLPNPSADLRNFGNKDQISSGRDRYFPSNNRFAYNSYLPDQSVINSSRTNFSSSKSLCSELILSLKSLAVWERAKLPASQKNWIHRRHRPGIWFPNQRPLGGPGFITYRKISMNFLPGDRSWVCHINSDKNDRVFNHRGNETQKSSLQ